MPFLLFCTFGCVIYSQGFFLNVRRLKEFDVLFFFLVGGWVYVISFLLDDKLLFLTDGLKKHSSGLLNLLVFS